MHDSSRKLWRTRWAILAFVSALSSPIALAAAPSSREDGRAKLEAGVKLLDAGDFAAALVGFEAAYAAFPSPKVFYNIGLAYKGLNKPAMAFMAFERFLQNAPDASQQHLQHARQELERLSKRVAFVSLSSDVREADILIDGTSLGQSTLPHKFPVDTGPHKLVLSNGVGSRFRQFTAVAGEPITLNVVFQEAAIDIRPPPVPPPPQPSDQRHAGELETPSLASAAAPAGEDQRPSRSWLPYARWGTLGVAVATLGLGVFLNVGAVSKRQAFDEFSIPSSVPSRCGMMGDRIVGPMGCEALAEDFKSARRNASIAYAAGGTLAAARLVFFLIENEEHAPTGLLPGVLSNPLGVTYAARF